MKTGRHLFLLFTWALIFFGGAPPVLAVTLNDVLDGMNMVRRPDALAALSYDGEMRIMKTAGTEDSRFSKFDFKAKWMAPDKWRCKWNSEIRDTSEGDLADPYGQSHPAVDHVLLSRPDFMDCIRKSWSVEYSGSAYWDNEPAWQLIARPRDIADRTPEFRLFVRKNDFCLLRTAVDLPDGTSATTDFEWMVVDAIRLAAKFKTRFEPPLGPVTGFETTFFNYQINPDLTDKDFPRVEMIDTIDQVHSESNRPDSFEGLYHGFEGEPVTAYIHDASGIYDRLNFTFALKMVNRAAFKLLEDRKKEIRNVAADAVSEFSRNCEEGLETMKGKWECGRAVRDAINLLLGQEVVSDFYFLDYILLKPGDE